MATRSSSFRREDNEARGRHLVATRKIYKDELVFCERPLCSLQSVGNCHEGALVCRHCRAFCGGPSLGLKLASGRLSRQDVTISSTDQEEEEVVSCRQECGEVYCSAECERDFWPSHSFLCTGSIDEHDENHPLLQWKMHAIENNEIFLMVGDVISAILAHPHLKKEFTDFTLVPWWEVVTLPSATMDAEEARELQETCQRLCQESAELLNQALKLQGVTEYDDLVTPLFVGQIIGSFEQNAIGIRKRHPLCRDVLSNDSLRNNQLQDVVRCLEKAGYIGGDDDDDGECDDDDCGDDHCGADHNHSHSHRAEEDGKQAENVEVNNHQSEPKDEDDDCGDDHYGDGHCGADHGHSHSHTSEEDGKQEENVEVNNHQSESKDEDDDCGDGHCGSDHDHSHSHTTEEDDKQEENVEVNHHQNESKDEEQGNYYSADEIAEFLSQLDIDDQATEDDLDALFTPLDGTAMYSTTCKMNHSCNPNVMAIYRGVLRWNDDPLAVHVVALRDIKDGEELCISYIDVNETSYAVRQGELANYGFVCTCERCASEKDGTELKPAAAKAEIDEDDLFGGDEDDEDDDDEDDDEEEKEEQDSKSEGQEALHEKLEEVKLAGDTSTWASLPVPVFAEAQSFVIQHGPAALKQLDQSSDLARKLVECIACTKLRSFSACIASGCELEEHLYKLLQEKGAWPESVYTEIYWVCSMLAAVGYAHYGYFLLAQQLLDKAMILGLNRQSIKQFFSHIEEHSSRQYQSPLVALKIANETFELASEDRLKGYGLAKEMEIPLSEIGAEISYGAFEQDYVRKQMPVVVRGLASSWTATSKWRDLSLFSRMHGNRLVPIEIGSMLGENGMKEKLLSVRSFISEYFASAKNQEVWSLNDAVTIPSAYLAQHALLDQIPQLLQDVDDSPPLCGPQGPSRVNVWMGTGGTRTPLHYDSYDNLLVQLVGAKYVRIYGKEETGKLYVSKVGTYGSQGNMSAVDCERENFEQHPLARDAKFQEVLLLPGDALFIPSRAWHYVRSLSSSVSVNYWW